MVMTCHLKATVGATSYNNLFQFMHRWKQLFVTLGCSNHLTSGLSLNLPELKTMAWSYPGEEITGCSEQ
jgi:hypothetical protein